MDLEKKERMTYKDHVAYIEKVRPVLIKEREIMNSAEWKRIKNSLTQMKKNGLIEIVPSGANNWAVTPTFDYLLDIMKYDGVDLDELKEELLNDDEEIDDLDEELEENEEDSDEEVDPEFKKKLAERIHRVDANSFTEEETIEKIDSKKKEKLTKKRVQSIETFKKNLEWLDEVRPILIEAREIRGSDEYRRILTRLAELQRDGKIKESPSSKNNWSIEFTDSFLATEATKEEYRSQRAIENSSSSPNPSIPAADSQIKEKKRERNINAKRKQEFISLCASAGMTEEEAEEYWEEQNN